MKCLSTDVAALLAISACSLASAAAAQDVPVAAPTTSGGDQPSFFEGLSVDLKTFTAKDDDRSALGLGLEYDRTWNLGTPITDHGVPVLAIAAALRGTGNCSFDPDVAPNDFLQARAGFDCSYYVRSDRALPEQDRCNLLLDLRAHGGFESDQQWTARNATAGGTLVVDVDGGPTSWLAAWNPFDLPFRATRWLTGYSENDNGVTVVNRAEAVPCLMFTAEEVESLGQDPRQQVGDTSSFVRLSFETAMSAPFIRVGQYHIAAEFNYRAYYEPGASQAVRDADLDFYDCLTVALEVGAGKVLGRKVQRADGIFVSYRNGRLPFDTDDEDVFELGFHVHF